MILPLEKQLTNLELSQKMKELGFRQDSLYYYPNWDGVDAIFSCADTNGRLPNNVSPKGAKVIKERWYSAYTATELQQFFTFDIIEFIQNNLDDINIELYYEYCNTPNAILNPDFLAKILILVKENNLL